MVVAVFTMATLYFGALWLEPWAGLFLMREDGPVENATVVLYGVCLVAMVVMGRRINYVKVHWYAVGILLVLALRELDWHKEFTTMGIFRTRFFLSDKVPGFEKFIGLLLVLMILAMLIIAVRRHWKTWWSGLTRGDPISIGITVAVTLGVLSKTMDGSKRKFETFGVTVTQRLQEQLHFLEETFELGIPAFLLIALYAYTKRASPSDAQEHNPPVGRKKTS